ncbi:MAG: formylglycine-generating enzyme family protein [Thermogutta sp.]
MRQKGLSRWCLLALGCLIVVGTTVRSEECGAGKPNPAEDFVIKWLPEPYPVPDADAKTESEMKPYTEVIVGTDIKFDMVPIPGGKFIMGSPENEAGRKEDEGPQHEVEVEPFWMAKYETLWDAYETWSFELDKRRREQTKEQATKWDEIADAIARPTPPYTDMSFGMGKKDRPAVCMTLYAAQHFCKWLSAKTGRYYRLPTEAEWEYACRAGTKTAYSFGNNPDDLEDYGWFFDNADDKYHKVGEKKPNPWGLYDMHGNVAEWVLDQYVADAYKQFAGKTVKNPLVPATKEFPVVVRGGSWMDDPEMLRSAARRGSHPDWKMQDPQIPQSIWYLTDAPFVGFRVIRPLRLPTEEEAQLYEPDPEILRNYRKAQGGKQ